MKRDRITRREFVSDVGRAAFAAGVAPMIVPRHVLGGPGYRAPSDRLNIAMIGGGGMGAGNAQSLVAGGENIVAIVDVDFRHVDSSVRSRLARGDGSPNPDGIRLQDAYARAARYADFRRMLEERDDIDAVVVATPDHMHAIAAATAMQLGKHVYVQKPLTYSVHEARVLARLARSTGVVTQMGNQGHSTDNARRINEWIQAGVIGPVDRVHVWTNRPIWPQGLPRPAAAHAVPEQSQWHQWWNLSPVVSGLIAGDWVKPEQLDWDLFLGPAREVPYHPLYHPFSWRGWVGFGVGAIGDMGAHLIDHPYWALNLSPPTSIQATSSPWGPDADGRPATYPLATMVDFDFPARGARGPVHMTWYDGGLMPRRPELLPADVALEREGGVIYVGERGILMHETYGGNPRVFPESLQEEADRVPESYPRIEGSHEMNWARAARGEVMATSPFDYAAPLTETMLLGIVALRAGQGVKIEYDPEAMRVTSHPDADQYLYREYRDGWTLPGA